MIFEKLANLFFTVITSLLSWINIPNESAIFDNISSFITLIVGNGWSIFSFFIPSSVYRSALTIIIIITASKYIYYFVMWIIKKIPMAGMS